MRTRLARTVLVGLSLLSVALLAAIVYPFASAFLFAAVLAGSFNGWVDALTARLGGRRPLAAGLITVAAALLIVLPVAVLVGVLGREAMTAATHVRDTLQHGGLPALLDDLPPPLRALGQEMLKFLPQNGEPMEDLGAGPSQAAAAMGGVLMATSRALLEIGLMLVALYFLLVDGPKLVDWLAEVTPIGKVRTLELLSDFRNVSEAVLFSSFATAGVQSLAALAGFLVVGAPQPLLFALATFIVAFIPVLGAASVSLALSVWLYLTGQLGPGFAIGLGLWSVLGVGLADNLVKPLLMKGRMEIHGAVIFFALVGGMAAFGPVGLAAGPLIVSFFLAIVRMCRRDLRVGEGGA
ncbi:MAG TPA: AI-2E family transporter [Vicinamibacteria bacterium]